MGSILTERGIHWVGNTPPTSRSIPASVCTSSGLTAPTSVYLSSVCTNSLNMHMDVKQEDEKNHICISSLIAWTSPGFNLLCNLLSKYGDRVVYAEKQWRGTLWYKRVFSGDPPGRGLIMMMMFHSPAYPIGINYAPAKTSDLLALANSTGQSI